VGQTSHWGSFSESTLNYYLSAFPREVVCWGSLEEQVSRVVPGAVSTDWFSPSRYLWVGEWDYMANSPLLVPIKGGAPSGQALLTVQVRTEALKWLTTRTRGARSQNPATPLLEIRQAAEFLDLPELLVFVTNIHSHEEFLNTDLKQQYRKAVRQRLQDLCLCQGLFSDIVFQLDDGSFAAHRPMLMARCDMMKAMFSGDFRESNAKVVSRACSLDSSTESQ
ncbi:unnamed protein product, partial [Timema podura]|nr:unnamed protein product [Timema podura]